MISDWPGAVEPGELYAYTQRSLINYQAYAKVWHTWEFHYKNRCTVYKRRTTLCDNQFDIPRANTARSRCGLHKILNNSFIRQSTINFRKSFTTFEFISLDVFILEVILTCGRLSIEFELPTEYNWKSNKIVVQSGWIDGEHRLSADNTKLL